MCSLSCCKFGFYPFVHVTCLIGYFLSHYKLFGTPSAFFFSRQDTSLVCLQCFQRMHALKTSSSLGTRLAINTKNAQSFYYMYALIAKSVLPELVRSRYLDGASCIHDPLQFPFVGRGPGGRPCHYTAGVLIDAHHTDETVLAGCLLCLLIEATTVDCLLNLIHIINGKVSKPCYYSA